MSIQTGERLREVEFRLGDVSRTDFPDLLRRMTGDAELTGTVVEIVYLGNPPEAYAMMQVEGIRIPLLVPVAALQQQ